jgi:hypothetical protein
LHYCPLEGPLGDVVVKRHAGDAQEQGQGIPALLHVADRLPETGVGLDEMLGELPPHALTERHHARATLGLVSLQPLLGIKPRAARLGIGFVHLAQGLEHKAHLVGEVLRDLHVFASGVGDAVRE